MAAVRSNSYALAGVAVFLIIFMGLAHTHLSALTTYNSPPESVNTVNTVNTANTASTATHAPQQSQQPEKPQQSQSHNAQQPQDPQPDFTDEEFLEIETNLPPPVIIPEAKPTQAPSAPHSVNDVFGPAQWVHPAVKPDDKEYAVYGHWPDKLPSDKPIWTKPLGERLCIIDMESRTFNKPGQLWSSSMTWNRSKEVHGPSGGTLNHWAYAKIHGYKYYYVKINTFADRRDSWKKPSVLSKLVKKHDVCVFIDSDAMFNHMDLPMEWLMNYWKISPHNNSMALPYDPNYKHNLDAYGQIYLNTGFMIMQNNPKLYQIFKDWDDCPNDGGKHPNCTQFRNRKGWQPTDQGGFGTFIRYDYPNDILSLPCDEANGFPESGQGCNGKFVKHVWIGKEDRLVQAVGAVFPGVLLETFHRQFVAEVDSYYTTEDILMADGPAFT